MALLTLAILPLGIISVSQTYSLARETRELSEDALLALTEQSAARERDLLQNAFGVARALGTSLAVNGFDPEDCRRVLTWMVENDPTISFAGVAELDGRVECTSMDRVVDMSDNPMFAELVRKPTSVVSPGDLEGGAPVLHLTQPIVLGGELLGFTFLSIPQGVAKAVVHESDAEARVAIFNVQGELLSQDVPDGIRSIYLPGDADLTQYFGRGPQFFTGITDAANIRDFAVVPVIENKVYAIGSWKQGKVSLERDFPIIVAMVFPILMWCTGLGVAYFGLHRLALRHVEKLRRNMRAFSMNQHGTRKVRLDDAPDELVEMADSFNGLVDSLQDKTKRQERHLQQKSILLREVHHRVKNNLQLIASMMNMQMRNTGSGEAKQVLRRLHERVLSLASIHRNLYSTAEMSSVPADRLLAEIVEQTVHVPLPDAEDVTIEKHLDPLLLHPDQAVPLSLLASEALANAAKYLGRNEAGDARLAVSLHHEPGSGTARLVIENTTGAPIQDRDVEMTSDGLGTRLIRAFVLQLDGDMKVDDSDGLFRVVLDFNLVEIPEDLELHAALTQ